MRAATIRKLVGLAALATAVVVVTQETQTETPVMTLAELRLLALSVGFPDPDLAAAVAMAESGGKPSAVGDAGTSFGLWQVHTPAHPEYSPALLLDPTYNARAALAISSGGANWQPWSTFNSGAYKKYLPAGVATA